MTPKIQTVSGYAIPPAPRHSVTVHFPGWENAIKIRDRHLHPTLLSQLKSFYPRVMIHADVAAVRLPARFISCFCVSSAALFSGLYVDICTSMCSIYEGGKETILIVKY